MWMSSQSTDNGWKTEDSKSFRCSLRGLLQSLRQVGRGSLLAHTSRIGKPVYSAWAGQPSRNLVFVFGGCSGENRGVVPVLQSRTSPRCPGSEDLWVVVLDAGFPSWVYVVVPVPHVAAPGFTDAIVV